MLCFDRDALDRLAIWEFHTNRTALLVKARRLIVAGIFSIVASASVLAESTLRGEYDVEGQVWHGRAYTGQAKIAPRGEGYAIAWRLGQGDAYRGVALKMDNVLGAVYWSDKDRFRGLGIVAYRIDGGELHGIWMLAEGGKTTGREDLKGSPDLTGDYIITLGENPDDLTNYDGHVRIEHRGDVYQVTWYTPNLSYVGNGIRIGDILVVGYALEHAPGTVRYCVGKVGLVGIWAYGDQAMMGKEMLKRRPEAAQPSPENDDNAGACQMSQFRG
jgi:hypothetical protein